MNRIISFAICMFTTFISFAQPRQTGPFKPADYAKAMKGAVLNITADKYIAEVKESIKLTVTMDIVDENYNSVRLDYRPEDPATAPWFVQGWKIVEGGGTLTSDPKSGNNYYAVLIAPDKIPANKCVIVEVTMHSLDKDYPEVILRQSIYIEDNANVFYVNCPYLNIKQEKWVIEADNGVNMSIPGMPSDPKNVNEAVDAKQKAALEKIQAAQAQQKANSMGIDLAAITSNCKAVYSAEEKTTAITLMGGVLKAIDGMPKNEKNNFLITLSVPGRGMERVNLKTKKEISVAFTLPLKGAACGCNDDPEWKAEREKNGEKGPTCNGGFISVDEVVFGKDGFVKGHFQANVEGTTSDGHVFYADIEGKFRAKLAN